MTNLNPKIWGPHAWFFIESIVIGLPDKITNELQNELKHFFISISFLLPCETCRHHFSEYIKTTDIMNIDFSTKTKILTWVNNIHNDVRKRNKTKIVSLNNTIQYYNSKYNLETKTSYSDIFFIGIFIIILLVILKYIFYPNLFEGKSYLATLDMQPSASGKSYLATLDMQPSASGKSYLDMQPSTSGIIPSPANIISNTVSFNPIVSNRIDL